jgi:hypothetical protein
VIGKYARHPFGTSKRGARDARPGAVSADNTARTNTLERASARIGEHHDCARLRVALDSIERARAAGSPVIRSARAQPFVKAVAIDHADKAAISALVDRHIDRIVGGTYHPG